MEVIDGVQFLPGASALLDQLDSKVLLMLRDGRHLTGILRNFDQYLNMTLDDAAERIIMKGKYCDVPLGLYIVRGDNIVLIGEIDESKDDSETFKRISPQELAELNDVDPIPKMEWENEGS